MAAEFHDEARGSRTTSDRDGERVVKAFLEATGTTANEATYLPWHVITEGSPWLWEE